MGYNGGMIPVQPPELAEGFQCSFPETRLANVKLFGNGPTEWLADAMDTNGALCGQVAIQAWARDVEISVTGIRTKTKHLFAQELLFTSIKDEVLALAKGAGLNLILELWDKKTGSAAGNT